MIFMVTLMRLFCSRDLLPDRFSSFAIETDDDELNQTVRIGRVGPYLYGRLNKDSMVPNDWRR